MTTARTFSDIAWCHATTPDGQSYSVGFTPVRDLTDAERIKEYGRRIEQERRQVRNLEASIAWHERERARLLRAAQDNEGVGGSRP